MVRTALILSTATLLVGCDVPVSGGGGDAAPAPAQVASAGPVSMPAGLSSDEQLIWNALTPQAQAEAAAFIANGGTFQDYIAP